MKLIHSSSSFFFSFRHRSNRRELPQLPVLWHQALLTYVQRCKNNLTSEQKENLLELLKYEPHYKITSEVRRELQHAIPLDIEIPAPIPESMMD